MDADHFDAFILSLDSAIPRRVALAGALGTGLAGLLMRFGVDIVEARKRKKKKKCKGGKKKCGKQCRDLQSDPLHCGSCGNDCDGGHGCAAGNCSCPEGEKDCGEACIPQVACCSDADCGDGGTCVDGTCICPAEKELCGETCVDLATDGANCGACDTACNTNGCVNGFCTCQSQADCNGCSCALRLEDAEIACTGAPTTQSCSVDANCPARSFCRDTINGGLCSEPCPA
jgi:hypothetical protein